MKSWFLAIVDLIFPPICQGCEQALDNSKELLCKKCLNALPNTRYFETLENPMANALLGRGQYEKVFCLLYYSKKGLVHNLIQKLKYRDRPAIGIYLGKLQAAEWDAEFCKEIDYIVPVPLHPSRETERGYNQSKCFAEGLSAVSGIPIQEWVQRKVQTKTQTQKGREDRMKAMQSVFDWKDLAPTNAIHVLIVDDVLTTGSTIEAVAQLFNEANCKVSVCTIAYVFD